MAKRTVAVSDVSGETIAEGKGAKVRITFNDARRGTFRELDLTDAEAEKLGGRPYLLAEADGPRAPRR